MDDQTGQKIKPELRIISVLIKNPELEQYKMPKQTGLSYRTILRTLKPMENEDLIKQIRTEPSKKGGKEKKIYRLELKGALTYLDALKPQPKDYFVKDRFYYSLEKNNKIIMENLKPLTLETIARSLEDLGNQIDFPIFKQINWLNEHYGLDVFRSIVLAADSTLERDKLPNLNKIKEYMIASGDKVEDIELTLKDFKWLEEDFLREAFTEELAIQLPSLRGKGDLHNDTLERLFVKLISKIERKNQLTIAPLKEFVQTLK